MPEDETNPAAQQRRTLLTALSAQQKQMDILRGENVGLRNAVAFIAKVAGISDHPHIAALGVKIADVNNPAQPIPSKGSEAPSETTDGARAPLTTDKVDAVGETGGANAGVTPASTTDVTRPGEVMAPPAPDAVQDVEKMVSGTDSVPSPSQARIPIKIEAPAPPKPTQTMFPETGWTAAQQEGANTRMFASMHLARLRKAAGIEDAGVDDLALGQAICDDTGLTDSDITHETATLAKVVERRAANQQRTAGRSLVPQRATAVTRTVPSLAAASDEGLTATASADSSISEDELGFTV